jgi:hypothetical protein
MVKCRPARIRHFRSVVTGHMPIRRIGIIAIIIITIGTIDINIGGESRSLPVIVILSAFRARAAHRVPISLSILIGAPDETQLTDTFSVRRE